MPVRRTASRRAAILLAALVACLGLSIGGYHAFWRQNLKRFQEVRPGVLYRSGLASEWGLDYAVGRYRIKTVISAIPEDPLLRKGWFDTGQPSGPPESQCLARHGVQVVHLPMGDEACWPWPTPWQFEEFFRVCDERRNWPMLLHCVGGRHRTGVLSALFRLEYDRWDIEPTLAEMYGFDFGPPQAISEHNLRTYGRRARPDASQWEELRATFAPALAGRPPLDDEHLVYLIRQQRGQSAVEVCLAEWVRSGRAFALPLAARVLRPGEPLLDEAVARAAERLRTARSAAGAGAQEADLMTAAALVADFGSPAQQAELLDALDQGRRSPRPDAAYHELASGVLNRYTRNRLPYWQILLGDRRPRRDAVAPGRRYCDTVVARLSVVIDEALVSGGGHAAWDAGVARAEAWFAAHAGEIQLTGLVPPEGRKDVSLAVPGVVEEDLSRLRR